MGLVLSRFARPRVVGAAAAMAAVVVGVTVAMLAIPDGDSRSVEPTASAPTATPIATSVSIPTPSPEPVPTPIKHPGILDGMPMTDEEWEARKDLLPLAVMVDNAAGAYPQAGLNRADIVYEGFVEGGITRLMAVYWRQDAEKILPVRSARTPFVIWASELAALYGHAGGSTADNEANAIAQIIEYGIPDLNAFSPGPGNYYYRDADRLGPYDLATSTAYLREAAGQLGFAGPPTTESWLFRDPTTPLPKGERAEGMEIDFSGRLHAWQYIQWKWDSAARRYLRFQFGGAHRDALTDEQLAFATVIVMTVPERVVDDEGHVVLEQFGTGQATVFTGGQAFAGSWKKANRQARTRFYDTGGTEIVFERGPIFIEVLGQESGFQAVADAGDLRDLPKYELPPPGTFTPGEPEETPAPTGTPAAEATPSPSPPGMAPPATTPAASASPTSPVPSATPRPPSPTVSATPVAGSN